MASTRPRVPAPRALLLLVLALLLPAVAPAVQVEGLYEGQVPVAGEDEAVRAQALGVALRQVVSKITGIPDPGGPVVDAAVADPQRFLQRFQYRESTDAVLPLVLWARFDAGAMDALVRDAGLPVWGAQRPSVLAWVVLARDTGLDIVTPDAGLADEGLATALRVRAWQRGVPLSFPLLDLEDRARIGADGLWQLNEQAIDEASARYTPGAVLVGRVESEGTGAWVAHWWLREGDTPSRWDTRGLTPADTAAGAVDAVAQRLAARYAVASDQGVGAGIEVRVSGVRTLADYARTMAYLQELDQVSGLSLGAARDEEFSFRMHVRGGAEALRRTASFGGVLAAGPAGAEGEAVRFRLLP